MEDFLKKVTKLLSGLNEIQPNVSMSGLDEEALKIKAMKNELTGMIRDLTPNPHDMNLVVDALREDLFSSLRVLQEQLVWEYDRPFGFGRADTPPPKNHGTDAQLMLASAAAENFFKRCQDYLSSKESLRRHCGATPFSRGSFELLPGEIVVEKTTLVNCGHETRCEGGANARS